MVPNDGFFGFTIGVFGNDDSDDKPTADEHREQERARHDAIVTLVNSSRRERKVALSGRAFACEAVLDIHPDLAEEDVTMVADVMLSLYADVQKRVNAILAIVADSWERLRGIDVYRLLSQFDSRDVQVAGLVVMDSRPDLSKQAGDAVAELLGDDEL